MKIDDLKEEPGILHRIEKISSDIQLLALNIAVAAAKMAHKKNLGPEINQRLSQLVNEASQAVKQMNQILRVAKSDHDSKSVMQDSGKDEIDDELLDNIDHSLKTIISDSENITRLLMDLKKGL